MREFAQAIEGGVRALGNRLGIETRDTLGQMQGSDLPTRRSLTTSGDCVVKTDYAGLQPWSIFRVPGCNSHEKELIGQFYTSHLSLSNALLSPKILKLTTLPFIQ